MKILFVCNDPYMQPLVYLAVPEAAFMTFADFNAATQYIDKAPSTRSTSP